MGLAVSGDLAAVTLADVLLAKERLFATEENLHHVPIESTVLSNELG